MRLNKTNNNQRDNNITIKVENIYIVIANCNTVKPLSPILSSKLRSLIGINHFTSYWTRFLYEKYDKIHINFAITSPIHNNKIENDHHNATTVNKNAIITSG